MRRISQRNHLVTLSEINITPLLDLAFTLLIIFIITTPMLEQGISLNLPTAGKSDGKIDAKDVMTVEVSPEGIYMLNGYKMGLDQVEQYLVAKSRANQNMVVYIRADENGPYGLVAAILNRCEKNNITRVSLRTDPRSEKKR
jgi:biopolymer transport protein ExbD